MTNPHAGVAHHYTVGGLGARIMAALEAAGKDVTALAVDDLAPVDAFHLRGRPATAELAGWAGFAKGKRVLDVGCGIGGTARYLANTFGCEIEGIDLTEEYIQVAEMLTEKVDLADRVIFHRGSALDLPFPDRHFDFAWTEHVQMNIPDKTGFYSELARVLRPGGRLAFHDIFASDHGESDPDFVFPVPWASRAEISHLTSVKNVQAILDSNGLVPVRWEDKTQDALAFLGQVLGRIEREGWMPIGLHILVGDEATLRFQNVRQNLEAGRLQVIQAVMAKP